MPLEIDITSQEYLRDPTAALENLRASGSVVEVALPFIGKAWVTTTRELTDRMLKDSQTFTMRAEGGASHRPPWWVPSVARIFAENMQTMDEPDHARLRAAVDEAFRRRAILDMEPRIQAISDELADALFATAAPADLVDRYSRKLPLAVICELLGLPLAVRPKFMDWAIAMTHGGGLLDLARMILSIRGIKRALEKQLEAARTAGGEGLIAELVRVEKEGAKISRDEMVSMLFLLLVAGHEVTTHLISGSVFELLKSPRLRDWLAADWSRAEQAVEEFLRFVTPTQISRPRFVRRDTELGGVRLKKGDKIMGMLVAANLDPFAHAHPEKLDLERKPNRHLAFGSGIHFCLGHQLARLEGRCALKALFRRWPQLALAVDPASVRWGRQLGQRAIESLPVVAGR
jgi:cytochrome P450 PksS